MPTNHRSLYPNGYLSATAELVAVMRWWDRSVLYSVGQLRERRLGDRAVFVIQAAALRPRRYAGCLVSGECLGFVEGHRRLGYLKDTEKVGEQFLVGLAGQLFLDVGVADALPIIRAAIDGMEQR